MSSTFSPFRAASLAALVVIIVTSTSSSGVDVPSALAAEQEPAAGLTRNHGPWQPDERSFRAYLRQVGAPATPTPEPSPTATATPVPVVDRRAELSSRGGRPAATDQQLSKSVPPAIARWEPQIMRAAKRHRVDPNLIAAVMMVESGGNPRAVSPAGAIGLMQIMGGSFDPDVNVNRGAEMLDQNMKMFGSLDLALAAYNAGPGNVKRYGGVPPFAETHKHIARTRANYERYSLS